MHFSIHYHQARSHQWKNLDQVHLNSYLLISDRECINFQLHSKSITMKTFSVNFISLFIFITSVCIDGIPTKTNKTHDYADYPEAAIDKHDLWRYNKFDTRPPVERTKRSPTSESTTKKEDNIQNYLIEAKLCESKIVFTRPQRLKNLDDKVQTIVNHRNYTQYVRFEECEVPSFPCTRDVYPFNVRSFCQQNYHKINLLAYDEDMDCLKEDEFIVPATCDCMIDTGDLLKGVHINILSGKS